MATSKVLIVHEPTMGMHHDAVVLANALKEVNLNIKLCTLDIPWNPNLDYESPLRIPEQIEAVAPFDAVFLFEHLYGHAPLRSRNFARRRIFIPNIEWVLPQDEAEVLRHRPDAILYKNSFSRDRCEKIPGFRQIPVSSVTGWTSQDFRSGGGARWDKNFRSFLHIKGLSDQKQTSMVLEAWLQNPDFPPLTIIASMHDSFQIPVSLKAAENVELVMRTIPAQELQRHQETCGVHVYPSFAEGFGHSLNEARVCQSVLVTTDGPPMNGLVTHLETGFLVPVKQADITTLRRSASYAIQVAALADTIREVLATPERHLREMGRCSREAYIKDASAFRGKICELFAKSGALSL